MRTSSRPMDGASLRAPANDHPFIWPAPDEVSSQPEGNGFGIALAILGMFILLGVGLFAAAIGLWDIASGWSA